jgi:hypothetical protein
VYTFRVIVSDNKKSAKLTRTNLFSHLPDIFFAHQKPVTYLKDS